VNATVETVSWAKREGMPTWSTPGPTTTSRSIRRCCRPTSAQPQSSARWLVGGAYLDLVLALGYRRSYSADDAGRVSAYELVAMGIASDVDMVVELDCDDHAVVKEDDAFTALSRGGKFAPTPSITWCGAAQRCPAQNAPSITQLGTEVVEPRTARLVEVRTTCHFG